MLYSWFVAFNAMLQRTFTHPRNDGATSRHIWYKHPAKEDFSIKFLDVPHTYDDVMVKHADLVGMYDEFTDGQLWLMMDGKRLFQVPTNGAVDPDAVQHSSEVEIMSPEELREALKSKTSCQEAYDSFIDTPQNQRFFDGAVPRDDFYCEPYQCDEHNECRSHGEG